MNRFQILRDEKSKSLSVDYEAINYLNMSKDVHYRIGILAQDPKRMFISRKVHIDRSSDIAEETFCDDGNCCAKNGKSWWVAGCSIVKYNIDLSGSPINNDYKIMFWKFNVKIFNSLIQLNEKFSLADHDLDVLQIRSEKNPYLLDTIIQPHKDLGWKSDVIYQNIVENIQFYDPNKYGLSKLVSNHKI